jgi:hypothetical protein
MAFCLVHLLAGDIDASETEDWNSGDGFSQVGYNSYGVISRPFTGTFDGANHIIYGLHIAKSVYDYIGLFGYSTGTIKNVGLVGGSITDDDYVGGVVGGKRWRNYHECVQYRNGEWRQIQRFGGGRRGGV